MVPSGWAGVAISSHGVLEWFVEKVHKLVSVGVLLLVF